VLELNPTIWTIGHSNRTIELFIDLLKTNKIELVADIRTLPGSKRYPHFDQKNLLATLRGQAIDYVWLKELGGLRKLTQSDKNTAWKNKSFQAYAEYMGTDGFKQGIARLMASAQNKRTTIMCSEAVWWKCHRCLVADYLKSQNTVVMHILDQNTNQLHPYTDAAKIENGRLSYES
jgi:uncharacterized protein (DUF488 family)